MKWVVSLFLRFWGAFVLSRILKKSSPVVEVEDPAPLVTVTPDVPIRTLGRWLSKPAPPVDIKITSKILRQTEQDEEDLLLLVSVL